MVSGYENRRVTRPGRVAIYERSKIDKSLFWTPVCLRDRTSTGTTMRGKMVERIRKKLTQSWARMTTSLGPAVHAVSSAEASFRAAGRIQRWFRAIHAKVVTRKRIRDSMLAPREEPQQELSANNRKTTRFSLSTSSPFIARHGHAATASSKNPHVSSTTFTAALTSRRLERQTIANLFTAVKTGTASYIESKEASGQLTSSQANVRDIRGNTLLYYATRDGHREIARVLLRCGADVNARNVGGNTALHVAFKYKRREVLDLYNTDSWRGCCCAAGQIRSCLTTGERRRCFSRSRTSCSSTDCRTVL